MKRLLTVIALMMLALPALAQVVRYPVPGYPYPYPPHYPTPGYPYPFPPTPEEMCRGDRYDQVSALTEAAAQDKLDRFAAEKGVNCTLTSSSIDFATGTCTEVTGELYAKLKMSFNINCYNRNVSSKLRKTVIKYY